MCKELEIYQEKVLSLFSEKDIEDLKKFNELKVKVDNMKQMVDEQLKTIFKESSVKKFEGNGLRITYINETTRKTVDTNKLKEDGMYDLYTKDSKVKDSVRVEVVYE